MRVRVELTIEVDPEQWTTAYSVEGAAAIREDVRSKVREDVRAHLVDDLAVAAEVYVGGSSYRPARIRS